MNASSRPAAPADLENAAVPAAAAAIERALLGDKSRTEIVLVRHGQQAFRGVRGTDPEVMDPPLTVLGQRQAELVGTYLAGDGVRAVYSSGLRRARETAAILASRLPGELEPTAIDELREVEVFRGLPPDRPLAEILGQERLRKAAARFRRTRRFDAFPNSEPSRELRARAVASMQLLVARHESERIAVIAHGGIINGFLADVLGMRADMFFFPAHASISRALYSDDRWTLYSANETSHLRDEALVTF